MCSSLTEGLVAYLTLFYKIGKSRTQTLLLHFLGLLIQWMQSSTLLFT